MSPKLNRFYWGACLLLSAFIGGCSSYQPAVVSDRGISNPTVGWNGYSVQVPDGMTLFNPESADLDSAKVTDFQRWYAEEDYRASTEWYISYTERFLFESGDDFAIGFMTDTYGLTSGWASITSVQMQYFLQKLANYKKVVINDTKAFSEIIGLNGQRAMHVSGECRPYFRKSASPLAYEGYFVVGKLREAFWVEGFGKMEFRDELMAKVRQTVESLRVN
jgi:hypothetical protein